MSASAGASSTTSRPGSPPSSAVAAVASVNACLAQIGELVGGLSATDYGRPLGELFGGSIGGHVRHCLDHARALADCPDGAVLDYDARERGTDIERDPAAARAAITAITHALDARARCVAPNAAVELTVMVTGDGTRIDATSSFEREATFVLSHTIHHQAMIGGMARHLGVAVPESFGRAPSTQLHDRGDAAEPTSEGDACAR